jgi:starch synthase
MANGAAVVASQVGGIPEIVQDGVNGLLTSHDPAAVAEAIGRLLADRPLASRVAASGKARVEKDFTIDRMVTETLHVYERILA